VLPIEYIFQCATWIVDHTTTVVVNLRSVSCGTYRLEGINLKKIGQDINNGQILPCFIFRKLTSALWR
jgi:hypothetical protein